MHAGAYRIFNMCMWSFGMCIHTEDLGLQSNPKDFCQVWTEFNSGKMGGRVESLAENGHPYIWWSCMIMLNFGFRKRVLLLCATDSPTLGLWLQLFWTATSGMSHSYSHKGCSNKITAWPALPWYMLIIKKNLTSCEFPPMGNGIYADLKQ